MNVIVHTRGPSPVRAALDNLLHHAHMLANQAGILAVHCDSLGDQIDPNFQTSRAFIKTDIEQTRKALEKIRALISADNLH